MDSRKPYALSPMQQGLHFHYVRDGRSGVDVVQLVCDLPEAVDAAALRRAWAHAAERHEGLRAWFGPDGNGGVAQWFAPEIEVDWSEEDWSAHDPGDREARLAGFLRQDRDRGFDFAQPPLWRLHLIRYAAGDHRLVWTLHHVMADGRSCGSVLAEVFDEYDGRDGGAGAGAVTERYNGAAPSIVPSRVFLDWLQARDTSGDEAFWRGQLAGVSSPTRIADSGVPSGAGRAERERRLPRETTRALHEAAARHGVTLNTMIQAAWSLVLGRHAGSCDVVFGVIRAGRSPALAPDAHSVGVYINTVPMRVRIGPQDELTRFLREVRATHVAMRPHEHAPLARIQQWSEDPGVSPFDSILIYDHATLDGALRQRGGAWARRRVHHLEHTGYPLTAYAYGEEELLLRVAWAREHVTDATGERLLDHFATALEGMLSPAVRRVCDVPVLGAAETERLEQMGVGRIEDVPPVCIHELFAAAAKEHADAIAVEDASARWTFAELDRRAGTLAALLQRSGVRPGDRVGVALGAGVDLPVALLGVLRTGAAYVPLDPAYPADRLRHMAEDAVLAAVVSQTGVRDVRPDAQIPRIDMAAIDAGPAPSPVPVDVRPDSDAYVIYTSGSTGRPKGVRVQHRNVVNFFLGMDRHIERRPDDAWLALTSLSFDISVLELLWTLTRGSRIVFPAGASGDAQAEPASFSLFYFSSGGDDDAGDAYRLLLDGARWADAHGFEAVWTPERHFHAFGGLFPNPAVTGAAVAAVTERVQVRAGSVVLPLHDPVRVAEEWAVVDRMSGGRAGISIASGWHPEDFVLAPDRFAERRESIFDSLEEVRALWRGEAVRRTGPRGDVDVRTMPRPVQPELPVWLTTSGTRATFERAGAAGLNVLTHLLGQTLDDVAANIAAYREARAAAGHDPATGRVTLMVHTFVAGDDETAREAVRGPLIEYLASAVDLVKNFADAWTAVSRRATPLDTSGRDLLTRLSPEDREALLAFSFERYFETSGLLGSVEKCAAMARSIRAAGVDEIACLIDFGVDHDTVLRHLDLLDDVRRTAASEAQAPRGTEPVGPVLSAHRVTHVQCTPSRARLLLAEPEARAALGGVRQLLVGGEALPGDLARELVAAVGGSVLNMYGPTETTVWSCVQPVGADAADGTVPIGRPITNTMCRVVGPDGGLCPVGVPGELWIGGAGVTAGYLGRDELTAERFVVDPWASEGQVYRTGDIVRWRDDGVLEFLGRNDQQVKIRGHRIELGEIESALSTHPEVRDAAVAVRPDGGGGSRLVGYVVPRNGAGAGFERNVRAWLGTRLPDAMVPSAWMVLDALPLTPNGKLDRRALPEPGGAATVSEGGAGPATPVETIVAEVWREVLGVAQPGLYENFFDLGGHSLLTIQIQTRLQERLSRDVPITDIFRFPTIRSLASHLEAADSSPAGAETGSQRAERRRQALLRRAGRTR